MIRLVSERLLPRPASGSLRTSAANKIRFVFTLAVLAGCAAAPALAADLLDPDVFDWQFYRKQFPELKLKTRAEAAAHWQSPEGLASGRQAHVRFDPRQYLAQNHLDLTFAAAAAHYLDTGRAAGLQGLLCRDPADYAAEMLALRTSPKTCDPRYDQERVFAGADGQPVRLVVKGPVQNRTVSLEDFALPGDTPHARFARAFAAIRASSGAQKITKLTVPRATYRFAPIPGVDRKTGFLALDGHSDLEIDFSGSTLLFGEPRPGLSLAGSRRVLLRDAVLDYSIALHARGEIRQSPAINGGEKYLHVPQPASPGPPIPPAAPIIGVTSFDFAAARWSDTGTGLNARANDGPGPVSFAATADAIDYRAPAAFRNFPVGDSVLVRYYGRVHAITIAPADGDSAEPAGDLSFVRLTLHASPNMGFNGHLKGGAGLWLSDCRLVPNPAGASPWLAANIDAVNFEGASDILIEGGEYAHLGDDGVNIHARLTQILRVEPVGAGLAVEVDGGIPTLNTRAPKLFFFNPAFGYLGKVSLPASAVTRAKGRTRLALPAPIPGLVAGSMLVSADDFPSRWLIRGVRYADSLARGLLLLLPNGRAEANRIEHFHQAGILLFADYRISHIFGANVNVSLLNNTLVHTNTKNALKDNGPDKAGAISFGPILPGGVSYRGLGDGTDRVKAYSPETKALTPLAPDYPLFQHLRIAGNTISDTPAAGLAVTSARHVVIEKNSFTAATRPVVNSPWLAADISIRRSRDITLRENSTSSLYVEAATAAEISR